MSQTPPEAPVPLESPSILVSTKAALGVAQDDASFDSEILTFINAAFSEVNQVGVGPTEGLMIFSSTDEWSALIGTDPRLNLVKTYVYLYVKILFDPPEVGFVLTSMERILERQLWRLMVASDKPTTTTVDVVIPDAFGEPIEVPIQVTLLQGAPAVADGTTFDGGNA